MYEETDYDLIGYFLQRKEIYPDGFLEQRFTFIPSDKSLNSIENNNKIPIFVEAFNSYIEKNRRPPLQKEFVKHYIKINWNNDEIQRILKKKKLKEALYLRLFRTYPSFVRDFILYDYLKFKGLDVKYDYEKDIHGIDFVITGQSGTVYNLHCYVKNQSDRTNWREKKNSRHNFSGKHIDLALKRWQCSHIGDIMFYNSDQLDNLIETII